MSARDKFHRAVRTGLEKDGWTITDDPLMVKTGEVAQYIDLGAENLVAAEKDGRQIAVEIKSFLSSSPITDFHGALGQFLNYREALEEEEPGRKLYLAVPDDTFKDFFSLPFTEKMVRKYGLPLIVYNAETEVLRKWIN